MVYHPNSDYGKLTAIINSDKCICGNTKKTFKPFCYGCIKELEDEKGFNVKTLYRNGEGGLEAFMDGIEELGFKDRL